MADDNLESKLKLIENDSALVEYNPNFLQVGAKVVKEGLYTYLRGFLPNDLQQEGTFKFKNNFINHAVNPLLTTGVSYGLLYDNPSALSISICLGLVECMIDVVGRGIYYDFIGSKDDNFFPAFFLSEYLFLLGKYGSSKYRKAKSQLIHEQNLKSIVEKKAGTLSLPAPGEQGQLSFQNKTGAVSLSETNEDYFDSSFF